MAEGQQILQDLVEKDFGVKMDDVNNSPRAQNLSQKVHNNTDFEPIGYKKGAEALEKGYTEDNEVDNRANEVKNSVKANQDQVKTAVGTSPQYTVDGKTPDEVRDAVQGGKKALDQKYAKTPDSTIQRTAHSTRDAGREFRRQVNGLGEKSPLNNKKRK